MPTDLNDLLYGDRDLAAVLSSDHAILAWLATEGALASCQAELELIPAAAGEAIAHRCRDDSFVDRAALWDSARNVGYPILGLVRQIDDALREEARGYVHFGATTQDIMDTGLAIQLRQAGDIVLGNVHELGATLEQLVTAHRDTIMAGRTHGQQAVPTTLGAKLAVFLVEYRRHRDRLRRALAEACQVSLHGAGGTSAAFGPRAGQLRTAVARRLGLADAPVAWHVARDGVTHLAQVVAATAATCARLAREIIDLSRTEIAEVAEAGGHHRGASSTMPQKSNPIHCEAIIGFAVAASTAAAGLNRAMEAGHERAAGEWQVEWALLPAALRQGGNAIRLSGLMLAGLTVDTARMCQNMDADGGLIMSEAAMMRLAPGFGRERAHDLVYDLARRTRAEEASLNDLLSEHGDVRVEARDYLGLAQRQCDDAVSAWQKDSAPSHGE